MAGAGAAVDRRHEFRVGELDVPRSERFRPARGGACGQGEDGDPESVGTLEMARQLRPFVGAAAVAAVFAGHLISAQNLPVPTYIPDIKFASGRNIAPYLEGWIKNSDGTFDFVFGYFNRNTEQELVIPPGPDNSVVPGGPDRGQPTYFLPRRQPRIFRVRV